MGVSGQLNASPAVAQSNSLQYQLNKRLCMPLSSIWML